MWLVGCAARLPYYCSADMTDSPRLTGPARHGRRLWLAAAQQRTLTGEKQGQILMAAESELWFGSETLVVTRSIMADGCPAPRAPPW